VRQARVSTFKNADSCSDAEWEEILTGILTQSPPSGIETTAKVTSKLLTLSVRKTVEKYSVSLALVSMAGIAVMLPRTKLHFSPHSFL
jgi:hypothetical protein